MKHAIIVLTTVLLSSCAKYAQIYNTSPTSALLRNDDKHYPVFENDTIRIVYNFWEAGGNMSFAIFNKYNRPIYIDWKKCAYILNGSKNDYYQEAITTTAIASGVSYADLFGRLKSNAVGENKSVKNERIIFLPPNSGVKLSTYAISHLIYRASDFKEVKDQIKQSGEYTVKMGDKDAMINFRNFITYSITEDFKQEQYADNGFAVNSITMCNMKTFFMKDGTDKKGNPIYVYPRQSPDKFYLSALKPSQIK